MTKEEAKDFLFDMSNLIGTTAMEYWTEKDAEKMRQAVLTIENESAQSKQTDCEYCHEDSDGYVRPIEKNSHAWLVRRGRTMKLRVGFKSGYSECDILFCPMCGRRLTDG